MAKAGVALQLYTVRDDAARDFVGTLRKVAAIGYTAVEFAGSGGLSAAELRDLCAELGVTAAGSHTGIEALEDDFQGVVDWHHTMGARFVTVPGLPGNRFPRTVDAYQRAGEELGALGRRLRAEGLHLCYHNHAHEFFDAPQGTGLDTLYGASDPDDLGAELDVYWAAKANVDPAAYIRKLGMRCRLLHVKDMAADGDFAEVGAGVLNFDAMFSAADEVGSSWLIVEQDSCKRPPLEAVATSLRNLRAWGR